MNLVTSIKLKEKKNLKNPKCCLLISTHVHLSHTDTIIKLQNYKKDLFCIHYTLKNATFNQGFFCHFCHIKGALLYSIPLSLFPLSASVRLPLDFHKIWIKNLGAKHKKII